MIFGAKIQYEGPDGNTLVLDSDDGTRTLPITDEALGELDAALNPYRWGQIQKETVRAEREASGKRSWEEYRQAQARTDPEWADQLAATVDQARKMLRERGTDQFDPGDENDRAA